MQQACAVHQADASSSPLFRRLRSVQSAEETWETRYRGQTDEPPLSSGSQSRLRALCVPASGSPAAGGSPRSLHLPSCQGLAK